MRGHGTWFRRTAAILSAAVLFVAAASPAVARADLLPDSDWETYRDYQDAADAEHPIDLGQSDSHDGMGDAWDRLGIAGLRPEAAEDGEGMGESDIVRRDDGHVGQVSPLQDSRVAVVVTAVTGMAAAVGFSLVAYRMSHDDRQAALGDTVVARG